MHCAACNAPANLNGAYCGICGFARDPKNTKRWDRKVEAAAFEDLQRSLEPEETLLSFTRGRLAGNRMGWVSLLPNALLSPFVNLGLTGGRLILQPVQQNTGCAVTDKPPSFPISDVCAMTVSDADPIEEGLSTRLVIQFASGDSLRLRAVGRLANGARELVKVWDSLAGLARSTHGAARTNCPHCKRKLDRHYDFCPFCGREQGEG